MTRIRVLSIDGGGIRGIIPATVLETIEQRTDKRIADLFDLVAGTSTGGILALGLTAPGADGTPKYTASQLVDLYFDNGSKIFHRSLWHRLVAVENLAEEKYPADGIESTLHAYFEELLLSQAKTNVLVTSYEIEHRMPFFFRSSRAANPAEHPGYDFHMRDVARATSAAPTYFEPAKITPTGDHHANDYWALIDGGVFANNPSMCAYVEAKRLYPDATDIVVISLGTGELTRSIPYDEAKNWGLAHWAQPLLGVVFDGVSDSADYQLCLLAGGRGATRRYYRFQAELRQGNDDMDDTSQTNMRALRVTAQNMVTRDSAEIDEAIALLIAP